MPRRVRRQGQSSKDTPKEQPYSILVVDDEAADRRGLSAALARAGYKAIAAGNLAEAQQAIGTNTPDVILVDISLPGVSGLTLLDSLKRVSSDIPVIVMTVSPDVSEAVQAMKHGVQDYLLKPVDPSSLLQAIRRSSEIVSLRRELAMLRHATRDSDEPKAPIQILGGVSSSSDAVLTTLTDLSKMASSSELALLERAKKIASSSEADA